MILHHWPEQRRKTHDPDNRLPAAPERGSDWLSKRPASAGEGQKHAAVCSCVQLHLPADSLLFAAKPPASRGRPRRIIPCILSAFTAHGSSYVHRPAPLVAGRFAEARKKNHLQKVQQRFNLILSFYPVAFYLIKVLRWMCII